MKKIILVVLSVSLLLITGCEDIVKKDMYLPKAKNDKVYTSVGGGDELHQGDGYTLTLPQKGYRYDKDYDDGTLEEKWEYTKKDDVEIKVTSYKGLDEETARNRFLRENNEYIFEDLSGYPICGTEIDGDTLWFDLHKEDEGVYIVSWEYPKNTSEKIQKELSDIALTFELKQ